MKTEEKNGPAKAMAFYHGDGFTAAYGQAKEYAGKNGRIATMIDIVQARLGAKPGVQGSPWEKYYTTMSAEYLGLDRNGKKIIIVAHGIGPMATLDGVQRAYSWEYKGREKNRRGGRITQEEFWNLADGKFGPVSIVDFDDYRKLYDYPFMSVLKASQAKVDPLLMARFGPQCEAYVKYHAKISRAWYRTELEFKPEDKNERDPYIIQVKDSREGCSYLYSSIEKGYAFAHLLSTGALYPAIHDSSKKSLLLDVSCHDWTDGTRLVGIKESANKKEIKIFDGPNPYQILRRHWNELWQKTNVDTKLPFCQLMDFDGKKFTQYAKVGATCDTGEPEYLVNKVESIGKLVLFRTTTGGSSMFFRYNIKEVKMIAPAEANAYQFVGEIATEWTDGNPSHHTVMLQFYKIKADTTKRMIRANQLARNYELMMKFV